MKDWVHIYSSTQVWKAELMEGLLRDHGIPCVLMNKQDSSYLFGQAELYVKPEDALKAKNLLKTNEQ